MRAQTLSSLPAASKPPRKPIKPGIKAAMTVILAISVWACVRVFDQMGNVNEKKAQLKTLQAQLTETLKINEDAKKELDRLNDPEYKEEKIRKELQMAKQGETIYDVPHKR